MTGEDGKPLFWEQDDWRSRWLVLEQGGVLHRIERLDVDPADWREEVTNGPGRAICGQEGDFGIPGIFSRMGCKRCTRCCHALGIPDGDGAPGNAPVIELAGALPARQPTTDLGAWSAEGVFG